MGRRLFPATRGTISRSGQVLLGFEWQRGMNRSVEEELRTMKWLSDLRGEGVAFRQIGGLRAEGWPTQKGGRCAQESVRRVVENGDLYRSYLG